MNSDPKKSKSPLERIAGGAGRSFLSGQRKLVNGKSVSVASFTGHQIRTPNKETGEVVLLGVGKGIEVSVSRPSKDLAFAHKTLRRAMMELPDRIKPLHTCAWTESEGELSVPDSGDVTWETSGDATWNIHEFSPIIIRRLQEGSASPLPKLNGNRISFWKSKLQKEKQEKLESANVRPAISLHFRVQKTLDGESPFELAGLPFEQLERLSSFSDWIRKNDAKIAIVGSAIGQRSENEYNENSSDEVPSCNLTESVLTRTNLSRRARPPQEYNVATVLEPYSAMWSEDKAEFVRLLELSAITNRGGYFLDKIESGTDISKSEELVITFIKEEDDDLDSSFFSWANGVAIRNSRNGDPTNEDFFNIRIRGGLPPRMEPTAPIGSITFGWKIDQPVNSEASQELVKLAGRVERKSGLKTIGEIRSILPPNNPELNQETSVRLIEEARGEEGFHGQAQILEYHVTATRRGSGAVDEIINRDTCNPLTPDENTGPEREFSSIATKFKNGVNAATVARSESIGIKDKESWYLRAVDKILPDFNLEIEGPERGATTSSIAAKINVNIRSENLVISGKDRMGEAFGWTEDGNEDEQEKEEIAQLRELCVQRLQATSTYVDDEIISLATSLAAVSASPYLAIANFERFKCKAGFRSIHGNRLMEDLGGSISNTIFYTDKLVGPNQWPGVNLSIEVSENENEDLALILDYKPLEKSDGESENEWQRRRAYRAKELRDIYYMLEGASSNDVQINLNLRLHPHSKIAEKIPVKNIDVRDAVVKFLKDTKNLSKNQRRSKLNFRLSDLNDKVKVDDATSISFEISIERTECLPDNCEDCELDELGLSEIKSAISPIAISLNSEETEVPALKDIGEALQKKIPGEWDSQLAYSKSQFVDSIFWLIPETLLPKNPTENHLPGLWTVRPLNTELGAGKFPIPKFSFGPERENGSSLNDFASSSEEFESVDYDEVGRNTLSFLNTLVEKCRDSSVDVETAGTFLQKIDELAEALTSCDGTDTNPMVVPMFQSADYDMKEGAASAREAILDGVRSNLEKFYSLDTIVQKSINLPEHTGSIASYFGLVSPRWKGRHGATSANPTFSDFSIKPGESVISTTYDLPAGGKSKEYSFEEIEFPIVDLQLKPEKPKTEAPFENSSTGDFQRGRWLKLVTPWSEVSVQAIDPGEGKAIPAITRRYPKSGAVDSQLVPSDEDLKSEIDLKDIHKLLEVKPTISVVISDFLEDDDYTVEVRYPSPLHFGGAAQNQNKSVQGGYCSSLLHALMLGSELRNFFYTRQHPTSKQFSATTDPWEPALSNFLQLGSEIAEELKDNLVSIQSRDEREGKTEIIEFEHASGEWDIKNNVVWTIIGTTPQRSKSVNIKLTGPDLNISDAAFPVWAISSDVLISRNARLGRSDTGNQSSWSGKFNESVLCYHNRFSQESINITDAGSVTRCEGQAITVKEFTNEDTAESRVLKVLTKVLFPNGSNVGVKFPYDIKICINRFFLQGKDVVSATRDAVPNLEIDANTIEPKDISHIAKSITEDRLKKEFLTAQSNSKGVELAITLSRTGEEREGVVAAKDIVFSETFLIPLP